MSVYTELTDQQERMMIFNVYIVGSIGITLSSISLCSLIKQNQLNNIKNDSYYNYAIKLGIVSSICCILCYLIKLVFNDLIIPIDQFIINNIDIMSLNDSFIVIIWCIEKLAVYYGFTFIYVSLFNKNKIDLYLKILMIFILLITFFYIIFYLVDVLLVTSSKEIAISIKRDIYYCTGGLNVESSLSVAMVGIIAILSDFIYVGVLLYKYIYNIKNPNNNNYNYPAIKCIILLIISSAAMVIICVPIAIHSDVRYLVTNFQLVVDNLCLFLAFKHNEDIYNSLCGCICFKNKYNELQINDDDDDADDVDVDVNNDNQVN